VRVNTVSPGPVETDLWLGDHGVETPRDTAHPMGGRVRHRMQMAALKAGRRHPDRTRVVNARRDDQVGI
jgi:NAD(P)-dependent dehydrogenase (short-subunit alcohol dehydrogenase family)